MSKKKEKVTVKVDSSESKTSAYLGGRLIVRTAKKTINGKELNEVTLADGTAKILNDQDLKAQTTDEAGELIH